VKAIATALCLAALGLGACGGDDESNAEDVLREYVKAANDRDADKFCGDLATDELVEQITGATGDDARDQCRRLLDATQSGLNIELVDVKKVVVDGDRARVTALVKTNSGRSEQTYTLVKQDGDFRVTSNTGE
jgi:hypothetical protein